MNGASGELGVSVSRGRPSARPEATAGAVADGRNPGAAPAGIATSLPLLILCVVYAVPLTVAMMPVVDLDVWWHLRTGQWVVEHGRVPATDPFSRFGQGRPWVAYSWLFEVVVYGAYRTFGLLGVLALRLTLVFAIAVAVHRLVAKREPRFTYASALTGAALFALVPVVAERPWLFTIFFFTATVDTVLDLRAGRRTRTAWLLPAAYALWANIHIQFVYGLFVLALACVAPLVDRVLRPNRGAGHADTTGSPDWWRLVAISAACVAATLINPYHFRLYGVVRDLATQPAPYRLVNEHLAMGFRGPWNWAVLGFSGAAAFALGRRRGLSSFDVLLLVTTAYFSFHTQRDAWFVVLASLAILVTGRVAAADTPERFPLTPRRGWATAAMVAIVLIATGWRFGTLTEARLERHVDARFPAAAVAFVERKGYPGPLYNDFNWGGYLIWALRRLPVAVDGRTNLHGDERLLRFNNTYLGQRGWASDPDLVAARVVIWDARAPLASLLRLDARFELVYEDAVAVVFVRRSHS